MLKKKRDAPNLYGIDMSKVYLQTPFPYSTANVSTVKEVGKKRAQCISAWYIYELRLVSWLAFSALIPFLFTCLKSNLISVCD